MADRPLRETAKEQIRKAIVSGKVGPGERIKEVQLSRDLGISRTPLREALFELERDGFVVFEHNRGFSAAPLVEREIREAYPIVIALEVLAIKLQGLSLVTLVPALTKINKRLSKMAAKPAEATRVDAEWHAALVERCGNRCLLDVLEAQRQTVARYENQFPRSAELVELVVKQHGQVIAALDAGDVGGACLALENNWNFGMATVLRELVRGER